MGFNSNLGPRRVGPRSCRFVVFGQREEDICALTFLPALAPMRLQQRTVSPSDWRHDGGELAGRNQLAFKPFFAAPVICDHLRTFARIMARVCFLHGGTCTPQVVIDFRDRTPTMPTGIFHAQPIRCAARNLSVLGDSCGGGDAQRSADICFPDLGHLPRYYLDFFWSRRTPASLLRKTNLATNEKREETSPRTRRLAISLCLASLVGLLRCVCSFLLLAFLDLARL